MRTFDGIDLLALILVIAAAAAIIRSRSRDRRLQIEDRHCRNRRVLSTIDRIDEQTYRNELRYQLEHIISVGEQLAA